MNRLLPIPDTKSDFPLLSRNRSFDENLPFNEVVDADQWIFNC
ncbi:hypothetical protein [Nonlabens xiamenensis]|nr:hypothetical protein [Nonlabens xiamenensis]